MLLECRLILTRLPSLFCTSFIQLVYLLRCRLVTRLTLRQLLPQAPLSNSLTGVPFPNSGHPRSQVQNPLSVFCAQTDKGIVCLANHQHSVTTESANTYSQLYLKKNNLKNNVIKRNKKWNWNCQISDNSHNRNFFRKINSRDNKT